MKQNLEVTQKNKKVLQDKVQELEAMIESIENYIIELKDYEHRYTKEHAVISSQDKIIFKLRK